MKATTTAALGLATALLITACVVFEDRIAGVTGPELAGATIDAGCTGAPAFLERALAGLDPTAAAAVARGVETACTLRAERQTISATIYDAPLDAFCAETSPLSAEDSSVRTRAAFNSRRATLCEARP